MRLRSDLERQIYAAAYVAEFNRLHDRGPGHMRGSVPQNELIQRWEENCALNAVDAAVSTVRHHRVARKAWSG